MVKIRPIPEFDDLVVAARTGTLVPFIGAGVSMLAGSPSWHGLADSAIQHFVKERKINLSQFEQLKHLTPRVKLAFAQSLEKKFGLNIDYQGILSPVKHPKEEVGRKIYGYLSRLSSTFVTTNYDDWLLRDLPSPDLSLSATSSGVTSGTTVKKRPIYKVNDLIPANLSPNTVLHLHGSLLDPKEMILTTRDYTRHYSNDRGKDENRVLTFLKYLFDEKNVLFIGYGLEELEILEYVIQKARAEKSDSKEVKHFIIQGYFSHEQVLADTMAEYYQQECGVHLLPFSKDENGWEQLIEVIKELAINIPISSPLKVQEFQEMEALLNG